MHLGMDQMTSGMIDHVDYGISMENWNTACFKGESHDVTSGNTHGGIIEG